MPDAARKTKPVLSQLWSVLNTQSRGYLTEEQALRLILKIVQEALAHEHAR